MKMLNSYHCRIGVLLLGMLLLQPTAAEGIPHGKGMLFLVERDGLAPSYIFGTIHAEDKRVLQLPPPVQQAFDSAETVVLEMTMDEGNLMAAALGMLYLDGRDLPGVIGKQRYRRVVAAMADRSVPEDMLRSYKPWSVSTILSMPKVQTGMFLDMVLYTEAINRKKKVVGLESAAEQISIFDDLSDDLQIAMLDDTLDNLEQIPLMLERLMDAYLARDMEALVHISDEFMQQGDPAVEAMFQQRLVDDRNNTMIERLQPMLQKGRLFVAVGALHLPGKNGILQLLENMDYRVTAVY